MSRRLSILASVILLLFVVIAAQSANLQFFRAKSLDASPINPRNNEVSDAYRGEIIAADGTVLARSAATNQGRGVYKRVYPFGALTAGIVGYSCSVYCSTWGLESQYNNYLTSHQQPPQSFEQLLAPSSAADNIHTTLVPSLERVMRAALAGRNGAAVALNPTNGDILGMYSNPTYNPTPLTSFSSKVVAATWKAINQNNAAGFPPLGEVATQQTFPPGSTSKIVTTSAVVAHEPSLLTKYYPYATQIPLPDSNKTFHNYGYGSCGGTIEEMLPPSCDTGFAEVGLDLGANLLTETAASFGYNETPPLDLPGVVSSSFPTAASLAHNLPGVAYSAIGQENVRTTALQNALIAAAVGNGGVMMVPHFLDYVTGPDGTVVERYQPRVWKKPLTKTQADQIVPWMVAVATSGTAYGVFPFGEDVAAKTGTAETGPGLKDTDDWMIAFAPASAPTIAIAVVLPFQVASATGATVAGPVIAPVMKCALAIQSATATPASIAAACKT